MEGQGRAPDELARTRLHPVPAPEACPVRAGWGESAAAYYRRTVVPDESLVQTVLVNSGRFRLVNDNRRYADTCERPLGHARVVGNLAESTGGRYDFARRVDLVASAALLDELDARCR